MKKILSVFGTRPEAIKMAPLVKQLESEPNVCSKVCVTGQHREMLDQVLNIFSIIPDYDLDIMKKKQDLTDITIKILKKISTVYDEYRPDLILVHGDTTTSFVASLAAYYKQIKVGHVEAGLRTGNIYSPWPEEGNRMLTANIANLHFAPTENSKSNLINEGIQESNIFVTGNTVIDALFLGMNIINSRKNLKERFKKQFNFLDRYKNIILVTGHRRESFGKGFIRICKSIKDIATKNSSTAVVYPVHLNPNVQNPVTKILSEIPNVYLIKPLEYLEFIYLMDLSKIILTDSGGIQEEAPSLGKPVLVMRDNTERPEAVSANTVKLVGTNVENILTSVNQLLYDDKSYKLMSSASNPYGDGNAAKKIISIIREL